MSYSTKKTLQYGVTLTQESELAVHMFRELITAILLSTAPGAFGLYIRACGVTGGIDTDFGAHRMTPRAALERAARFVSAAVNDAMAPMRAFWPALTFRAALIVE
jgi:hypothetical protein